MPASRWEGELIIEDQMSFLSFLAGGPLATGGLAKMSILHTYSWSDKAQGLSTIRTAYYMVLGLISLRATVTNY
jgi:hypothetical protein